jgi:hypothetical protein
MKKLSLFVVAMLLIACAGCLTMSGSGLTRPVVSQTIASFHRPESATFSLDGKLMFVPNCASGMYGTDKNFALQAGQGAISKLSVSESGELKMLDPKFVSGLNAPLGITTLLKATKLFPAGTLFVNTGLYILCDEDGAYIPDPKAIGTGVTIIDPDTGKTLGRIDLTPGSAVTKAIGDAFPLPNGMTFDSKGNLYVTDTGESCGVKNTVMPAKSRGGVLRIDHEAIDSFAQNKAHAGIHFIPIELPNGVAYNPHTDSILVITCRSGEGEQKDSVYSIPAATFKNTGEAKPIASELGNMDGAVVTPAGSIIVSVMNTQSLWKIKKNGSKEEVAFDPPVKLFGPSDIKLKELKDGTSIIIVPEQDHLNPDLWQQRVRVVRIPEGY